MLKKQIKENFKLPKAITSDLESKELHFCCFFQVNNFHKVPYIHHFI